MCLTNFTKEDIVQEKLKLKYYSSPQINYLGLNTFELYLLAPGSKILLDEITKIIHDFITFLCIYLINILQK